MNKIETEARLYSEQLEDKIGEESGGVCPPLFETKDCEQSFIKGAEWMLDRASKWLVDNYPMPVPYLKNTYDEYKLKYLKACMRLVSRFVNEVKGEDVITVERLKEEGWEQILDYLPVPDENCFWVRKTRDYKLELCSFSNTPGKFWNVHVDNDRGESIASMDVQTFSDIDKLLHLIEN